MMRARPMLATCALLAFAGGCSFEAKSDALERNVCSVDGDCGDGSRCEAGMCVGEASAGLELSLVVTPMRMPNGSQPVPITIGGMRLDGPPERTIELPLPVTVTGTLRDRKKHVAAELHFSPMLEEGAPAAAAQLVTTTEPPVNEGSDGDASDGPDFSVQLLGGVRYRVFVEPTDRALPPYTVEMLAGDETKLTIDYAEVRWTVQRFFVQDAPVDRSLVIRAIDVHTGEPISSTGKVTDRPTTLVFGPSPVPEYRLELTAEESYAPASKAGSVCDLTTPLLPVLRVAQSALRDDEAGTHVLIMPKIPEPVRYSGVVQLCPGTDMTGLSGMPMALDARTLLFEGDADVEASYNATTTATLDEDQKQLRFCTRVLPGDYVVVITPPTNVECEIFAERTRIEDTSADAGTSDVSLSLRRASVLRGTLQTPDRSAVEAASVEANALGRDFAIDSDGTSVPNYNRSAQTSTSNSGAFRLPVDIGSYDVLLKPSPESGFAWHVLYDVEFDHADDVFVTKVVLDAPVVIDAHLRYAEASRATQKTLAGADVLAYAKIETPSGTRAIPVARAMADEDGTVTLLISPEPHAGR